MAMQTWLNEPDINISKFIDFDKEKSLLYDNLYLADYKIVIKTPFLKEKQSIKSVKIEDFDLTKYLYLLDYD